MKYYSPGAFNICKRQPMPSTAGPPLKIFDRGEVEIEIVDKGVTDIAVDQ